MINDKIKVTGEFYATLYDENMVVKQIIDTHNLVVASGKNFIASRMASNASSVMTHIGLGTNGTTPTGVNTDLAGSLVRTALDVSGGTAVLNEITYSTTFTPGVGTGTIVEAGIFSAISGGTMLARTVFTAVPKAALDTLVIVWKITIS
jgi:hypothetical protein